MAKKTEPKKQQQVAPTPKPEPVRFDGIEISREPRSQKARRAWELSQKIANTYSGQVRKLAADNRLSESAIRDDTRNLTTAVLQELALARLAIKSERAGLDKRRADLLPKPAPDLLGAQLHREIRDHIRGLPEPERIRFVLNSIDARDSETVAAVLGAPPYLTGLQSTVLDQVRQRWLETVAGDELARIASDSADLDEGGAALRTAERLVMSQSGLEPVVFHKLNAEAEKAAAEQQRQAEASAAIPTPAPVETAPVSREQRIAEYADVDADTIAGLAGINIHVTQEWLNENAYDAAGLPVDGATLNRALAKLQASQKSEAA